MPETVKAYISKDVFMTKPELGMTTTCGAVALQGAKPRSNAEIVDRVTIPSQQLLRVNLLTSFPQLVSQGLIILGKASMSEFCGLRADHLSPGYSAVNGQTQSPYIKGGVDKNDVFAGSAVGVAAGFTPLSLGTETCGSVVMPANRAGIYAIRATVGSTPSDGSLRMSEAFDEIGAMAKAPEDLIPLLEGLYKESARQKFPQDGLGLLGNEWKGMTVGFVDPGQWKVLDWPDKKHDPADDQIVSAVSSL